MPTPDPQPIFDALRAAQDRGEMPTDLDTAGLRELGADVLARSVFTARGTNAIFVSKLKEVVDQLAAGDIGEGQARTALYETLDALGYDVEKGGFPGEEVPPALKGTLQDLRSFRRMDLIIRTQLALMQGAGQQMRGMRPEYLTEFPAWELVRVAEVEVARDWPSRWKIAGGQTEPDGNAWQILGKRTGMVALKGDPVWGELGSYDNFSDALGVDHPPFYFNSEMGWIEADVARCQELGVTGPDGETIDEWQASQPNVLAGKMPLPAPRMSLRDVDPEIVKNFQESTQATPVAGRPGQYDYSDILAKSIAEHDAAYNKGGAR